jgi:DNA-binding MarR family transcriptional regulator/GNAT superfamily N-acetyltransferase
MLVEDEHVAAVRRFNCFYTRAVGALGDRHLDGPYALTELRVLYEIAHRLRPVAADIGRDLGLDPGQLSRILKRFEVGGLVASATSASDRRRVELSLTVEGRRVFDELEAATVEDVRALLGGLPPLARRDLIAALAAVERLVGSREPQAEIIRRHRSGEVGHIVSRHGALYADEYGWDERFEGLVARIAADFLEGRDPAREVCLVADLGGAVVGSAFVVATDDEKTAKLRLVYVEPSARGRGLGRRLVDEAIGFARLAGYGRMVLWTNDVLVSARRIYEAAGFVLVAEEPHRSFGRDLVGQEFSLDLQSGRHASGT